MTVSFVTSVCPSRWTFVRLPAWINSVFTARIFIKFGIWVFFWKSVEKIEVLLNSDKNNGYFSWRCRPTSIYDNISLNSSLIRNISKTIFRENQNKHLSSIHFSPRKSCRLGIDVEKYGKSGQATDSNRTRRMRFACWIIKATDTHVEYVILIALLRQQWFREGASTLRLYVLCLFYF